ncbi:MAG: peptidylprolyl isomerase [Alistipes sp.]|nr:peptidylprolyl isomerase [Alistipes sp.]
MTRRVTIALIIMTALALGVVAQKRQVMVDKVVAVVGGSSILHSEVMSTANDLTQRRREAGYTSDNDPYTEALEALLLQKLLYNQALIDSVEVNTNDLTSRAESQVNRWVEEAGSIPALEKKHHMQIYHLREMLRRRLEMQTYASTMQNEVTSKVTITPGEVERYYNALDKDSLPIIAKQYVYAQITKFPKSLVAAKQRTKERLLEMRERIITGKTKFSTMARMYSVDGSAIQGGEMEPQVLAGFVQPFADAMRELKPGQVSEVVETEFGFHLIQLIDRKGELYHCRHILLRPTYTIEELVEPLQELDSIADLIRKDSITFEAAAAKFSDDVHSKQNGGIVTNHDLLEHYNAFDAKLTATRFLEEDFGMGRGKSIEDYNAIRKLKVGEISPAFQSQDLVGNNLSKIVKLVEIIPPHPASLKDDYLRLEAMALADKQSRVFDEWVDKKIEQMYIHIDPDYRNLDFMNKNWIK